MAHLITVGTYPDSLLAMEAMIATSAASDVVSTLRLD
jgi:hypothetical protein